MGNYSEDCLLMYDNLTAYTLLKGVAYTGDVSLS